jgi:hypothetical protein
MLSAEPKAVLPTKNARAEGGQEAGRYGNVGAGAVGDATGGQALWTVCGHTPAMEARDMPPYYGTAMSTCGLGSMISAEQA